MLSSFPISLSYVYTPHHGDDGHLLTRMTLAD